MTEPRELVLTDIRYRNFGPGSALDTYFAWVAVEDGALFRPISEPMPLPGQSRPATPHGDWLFVVNAAHPDYGIGGVDLAGAAKLNSGAGQ